MVSGSLQQLAKPLADVPSVLDRSSPRELRVINSEIEPLCEISLLWREWELDGAMLHGDLRALRCHLVLSET
jgi:hypothetical protein